MYGMALGLFSSNLGLFGGVISSLCYLAVSVTVALAAYLPETTQGAARLGLSGAWHDGGYPARHFAFGGQVLRSAPVSPSSRPWGCVALGEASRLHL